MISAIATAAFFSCLELQKLMNNIAASDMSEQQKQEVIEVLIFHSEWECRNDSTTP